MPKPALTPELALDYLDELSTDVRAAVLLDERGELAAHKSEQPDGAGERLRDLARELFERADAAAPGSAPVPQLEVSLAGGAVYGVREAGWTLVVATGRFAMSSVMFYDLRSVISDLGRKAA